MSRQVLVSLSLTPVLTEAKLAVARQQARVYTAELALLHVLPAGSLDPEQISPAEAMARAYLDSLVSQLHAEGLAAHALVRAGPAASVILDEARERDACLIVLGSTGRARLPRTLLGSVADAVIRQATCPILLVRPTRDLAPEPRLLTLESLDLLAPYLLGPRSVDLARVVGSATRAHELGPDFRPLQNTPSDEQRFQSVLAAALRGEDLPPVELYKLGFGYYVRDGHHRVAAARQLNRSEIEATVVELLPAGDPEAHRAFQARREFERATGLTRVGAARAESYAALLDAIDAFAQEHGLADRREAARHWYDAAYRPLRRQTRAQGLLRHAPGQRSADLIASRVMSDE